LSAVAFLAGSAAGRRIVKAKSAESISDDKQRKIILSDLGGRYLHVIQQPGVKEAWSR